LEPSDHLAAARRRPGIAACPKQQFEVSVAAGYLSAAGDFTPLRADSGTLAFVFWIGASRTFASTRNSLQRVADARSSRQLGGRALAENVRLGRGLGRARKARFAGLRHGTQPHILVEVPSRVIVFSTDSCTFCVSAKSLLAKRGVVFEEINLAEDPELQAELAKVTGITSFPQIIVDGETIGGLNDLRAADKNGTLASWSAE
jgi:glutaredoxin 3